MPKVFRGILREFKQQVLFHAESFVQNAGILESVYITTDNWTVESIKSSTIKCM